MPYSFDTSTTTFKTKRAFPRFCNNKSTRMSEAKGSTFNSNNEMVDKLDEFVDFVTGLVDPKKRSALNLKKWHKTVLTGTKTKLQHKTKTHKKKSKQLSRAQYADLGLYNLPTKSVKYSDVIPLHQLWTEYIKKQLNPFLKRCDDGTLAIPDVFDKNYDQLTKLLVKSDLHGAKIAVLASCNPSLVGQTGIVALETRNTFKIVGEDNKTRTIPKPESVFRIIVDNIELKIFGKHLGIRPAERAVKKIKTIINPVL